MRNVTEFANFTLNKALEQKKALTTEGKSPEDTQTNLGESFKLEGEKLNHFVNSLEVASANPTNLKRVLVVSLAEGEKAPAKAVQNGEFYYVPEFYVEMKAKPVEKQTGKGGRNQRGGGGGRGGNDSTKKSSPWGLSPEEIAAKKGKTVTN